MKKNNTHYILDGLMVLLNLAAARGNVLLYWIFGFTQLSHVLVFVIAIDIIYLVIRFAGVRVSKGFELSLSFAPFYFTVALLVVNFYNAMKEGAGLVLYLSLVLLVLLFGVILVRLKKCYIDDDKKLLSVSKGYIWLSYISIGGMFISFLLDLLLGLHQAPISADFLQSNIDNGSTYYRSFFSMLLQDVEIRVPFFHQFGIFTGLFHEPQAVAHQIFPFFILMLGLSNSRRRHVLVITSALVFMLFTLSVTNLLVIAVCITVFFLIKSRYNLFGSIVAVGAILVGVLLFFRMDSSGTATDFIMGRLDADNGSQLYSISMIAWTFSPHTLLGNDFLNTEYVFDILSFGGVSQSDVGFIPCILFIGYLLSFLANTIRLILINNKQARAVGFASLYFILHGLKIGMPMLIQTLPILLIVLQIIALQLYGGVSTSKKSSRNRGVQQFV